MWAKNNIKDKSHNTGGTYQNIKNEHKKGESKEHTTTNIQHNRLTYKV